MRETNYLDSRLRNRSRSSARCAPRHFFRRDDSVTEGEMRDERKDDPAGPALGNSQRAEKVQRRRGGKDDREQRIEPGRRELRAVAHRDCFPSTRARTLFVEDLNVAADSFDTGVDEEIDFEGASKHDEGDERDAPFELCDAAARSQGRPRRSGRPKRHTIGPFRARGWCRVVPDIRPGSGRSLGSLVDIERYLVHFQSLEAFFAWSLYRRFARIPMKHFREPTIV